MLPVLQNSTRRQDLKALPISGKKDPSCLVLGTSIDPRSTKDPTKEGHPCLESNYSISSVCKQSVDEIVENRVIAKKDKKEWQRIEKVLHPRHHKAMHRMQFVIEEACRRWGHQSMAEFTLTFAEDVSYQVAQDRVNSLFSNVLRKRYEGRFFVVCERGGKNGRLHFHVVFQIKGSDFVSGCYRRDRPNGLGKQWVRNNKSIKAEFAYLRDLLPRYGFGSFTQVNPLQSVKGAAKYFSKYVGKGFYHRDESMVGKQLVRYGYAFQSIASTKFSFAWGGSQDRRAVMHQLSLEYGLSNLDDFRDTFGKCWVYNSLSEFRVASVLGGRVRPTCGEKIREEVLRYAWDKWKIKVWLSELPHRSGWVCMGGEKYQLKAEFAKEYIGRSSSASDDKYEPVKIHPPKDIETRAWKELTDCLASLHDEHGGNDSIPLPRTHQDQDTFGADTSKLSELPATPTPDDPQGSLSYYG